MIFFDLRIEFSFYVEKYPNGIEVAEFFSINNNCHRGRRDARHNEFGDFWWKLEVG